MAARINGKPGVIVEAIGAIIIVALMLGWALCLFGLERFYSVMQIIKRTTAIARDESLRLDTPEK